MLRDPATINLERKAAPAVGITQAVYPVPQHLKPKLLSELLTRGEIDDALVFTRTKHRADRLMRFLATQNIAVERIHGNRSQNQRTEALSGFKSGKYRVLVATDIAARGIDVTELGHVINFDVPAAPEDYIHRVGRTARAEAVGTAFTLVAPEEQQELADIEKAIQKRLPRVTLPGFNYDAVKEAPAPGARPHHRGHGHERSRTRPPHGGGSRPGGGGSHGPRRPARAPGGHAPTRGRGPR